MMAINERGLISFVANIADSVWGQDVDGVWHMVAGYHIILPCAVGIRVDSWGLPPAQAAYCRTCLGVLPPEVRAWLVQREVEL
jgi:hypothetical protein